MSVKELEMNIKITDKWAASTPFVIAGPCSAETEEQLFETAQALHQQNISLIRAGVWKPRTRPNSFEGVGKEALKWIENICKELPVQFAIEVATPQHVEEALKHGVQVLWIGARSTVNPFTVQQIADALQGTDTTVLIKNPINPDLALWMGAIERIYNAGIHKIGAIHRGFSSFQQSKYRNEPLWQIPIELKRLLPQIPMICDPSHICGNREMIAQVSQQALDLNFDGLIIETHLDPDHAWSDAKQQITPQSLQEILQHLEKRKSNSDNSEFLCRLEELRELIDQTDRSLLETLAKRMQIVREIGQYKKLNHVSILQMDRWNEIFSSRQHWAKDLELDQNSIAELYKLIHDASIKTQTDILNEKSSILE
jgi:chorismate mutase